MKKKKKLDDRDHPREGMLDKGFKTTILRNALTGSAHTGCGDGGGGEGGRGEHLPQKPHNLDLNPEIHSGRRETAP